MPIQSIFYDLGSSVGLYLTMESVSLLCIDVRLIPLVFELFEDVCRDKFDVLVAPRLIMIGCR